MGNSESANDSLDTYLHPRLGSIKRLQEHDGDQFIQYEIVVENQVSLNRWEDQLLHLKNTVCQQVLFLPLDHKWEKMGMCGGAGLLTMTFKDYMFSFDEEIKNRRQIRRPFLQSEIWYLLYNTIKASNHLSLTKTKIGNVQPSNILINQEGQIQILSQFSWPGFKDSLTSSLSGQYENCFLSPEQCTYKRRHLNSYRNIQNNQNKTEIKMDMDASQSQIFSIGMTILEASSLLDCSKLYYEDEINQFLLKEYIDIVENRYSKQLSYLIKSMLRFSLTNRITAEKIQKILAPYDAFIMKLEDFEFTNKQFEENQNQKTIGSASLQSIQDISPTPGGKETRGTPHKKSNWERSAPLFPIYDTPPMMINSLPPMVTGGFLNPLMMRRSVSQFASHHSPV